MFIRENHTKPATLANFRVLRSQCLETCQLRLLTLGVFLVCYVRRKESPSFREFRFRFRLRSGQERGRLRGERGLQMFLGDLHIFRYLQVLRTFQAESRSERVCGFRVWAMAYGIGNWQERASPNWFEPPRPKTTRSSTLVRRVRTRHGVSMDMGCRRSWGLLDVWGWWHLPPSGVSSNGPLEVKGCPLTPCMCRHTHAWGGFKGQYWIHIPYIEWLDIFLC